jgi:hypothetical protein
MKKLFVIIVSFVFCAAASAQQKTRWGVVIGMNSSELTSSWSFDSRIGFHLGVKAEIGLPQVTQGAYLETAMLLSLKGEKTSTDFDGDEAIKVNPYYLEIPVHIGYRYALNKNFNLFGSFGPYFAYGLFGKIKADVIGPKGNGYEVKTDAFGSNTMKHFDFGLGGRIGAEFNNKIQLSVGYDYGLTKPFSSDNASVYGKYNRNLSISVAYMY